MSVADPASAPPRTDLSFLRRRSVRRTGPPAAQDPQQVTGGVRPGDPAGSASLAEFLAGRATGRRRAQPLAPADPGTQPPAGHAVSSSLDLSTPAPTPTSARASMPAASPSPARASIPVTPAASSRPAPRPERRLPPGAPTILTATAPTVTLTRLQSAIGMLSFEAACSAEVGDLRLGCAYQLRTGESSTVQSSGGNRQGPPQSRRPVLVAGRTAYEHISVDLRQSRDLQRLAVFAFSESRAPLNWGGTLVVTTFGGAVLEVPLEQIRGEVVLLMTLYNVAGEFVLRAELQPIVGDVREACRAYGYDRITWLDSRTPVA